MRRLGPLDADHPATGLECPACRKEIMSGDYVALVPLGPGDDREARAHRDAGEAYNAVGVVVHWDCSPQAEIEADGEPPAWRAAQGGTGGP